MKAALTLTATDLARALRRLVETKVVERTASEAGERPGDGRRVPKRKQAERRVRGRQR